MHPKSPMAGLLLCGLITLGGCTSPPTIDRVETTYPGIREWPATWIHPDIERVDYDEHDSNDFEVELKEFPRSKPQPGGSEVCWAYCVSQMLKYRDIEVEPEELVNRLRAKNAGKGVSRGDAGSVVDMMKPLLAQGGFVAIVTANPTLMVHDLCLDCPIIVALSPPGKGQPGHAVVLVGIRFSFLGQNAIPDYVSYYDPTTGGIEGCDAREFFPNVDWAIHFRQ